MLICFDSMASLTALQNLITESNLSFEIQNTSNSLTKERAVEFFEVRGHNKIRPTNQLRENPKYRMSNALDYGRREIIRKRG